MSATIPIRPSPRTAALNGTYTDTLAANSFDCTFPDGPASSTVRVTADDGDPTNNIGSDDITVAVANLAPVVTLSGDDFANEGQTKTYTYTVTDAGADTSLVTEECGAFATYIDTATAFSFDCTFPDGPESTTVNVTADDGDPSNNIGDDEIEVLIANVAPSIIAHRSGHRRRGRPQDLLLRRRPIPAPTCNRDHLLRRQRRQGVREPARRHLPVPLPGWPGHQQRDRHRRRLRRRGRHRQPAGPRHRQQRGAGGDPDRRRRPPTRATR